MNKKEFFKTVYNRYTSIGLVVMGIYNVLLLFLYFKRWIGAMPDNMVLAAVDVSLVAGFTMLGIIIEFIRRLCHKKDRRPVTEQKPSGE